jgi:hypothetical protein
MPAVMLDGHTYEGKKLFTPVTLLSGHYHNHRALGQMVARGGWAEVRRRALATTIEPSKSHEKQDRLF